MSVTRDRQIVQELAEAADIQINGSRPWDIQVHDERLYSRIIRDQSIGFGEAYMDGWWDCECLDQLFTKLSRARLETVVLNSKKLIWKLFVSKYFNLQSIKRSFIVGEKHYDLDNYLYEKMLDPLMVYSCAYWKNADNLVDAQIAKLDLICRKVGLKKGQKILEIGCGWGSFAWYAATHYGVEVVGLTISKEQAKLAEEKCKNLPVEIRIQDYRTLASGAEQFDHIVSIGMFEHVGPKNYREYFKIARACLKDDGLFCLHTIGQGPSRLKGDDWVDKYVFPNGVIPSIKQVGEAAEDLLEMEDWHNFGPDYDKTLLAWYENFQKIWPELSQREDQKYDLRFKRMWDYYLLSCAGFFRSRSCSLWQIVFSKNGQIGGYESVR